MTMTLKAAQAAMEKKFVYGAENLIKICVDGYESGELRGRLVTEYEPQPVSFNGFVSFLKQAERFFDEVNWPQASTQLRRFGGHKRKTVPIADRNEQKNLCFEMDGQRGKLMNFILHVKYRQHSSWQGILFWPGGRQQKFFRSVLELALLLDSALCAGDEESASWASRIKQ